MKRWFMVLLYSSSLIGCCAAPTTSYAPPTAFIATVISQNGEQTFVQLDTGQTLELTGLASLEPGQRLYIQGTLSQGSVSLSSYQLL
ncbi:MAG: hypothetical protein KC422_04215 [Trueperaceae bacterium]|nr:hypothetical protein [Trueperaceae bacterium]